MALIENLEHEAQHLPDSWTADLVGIVVHCSSLGVVEPYLFRWPAP